MNIHVQQGGTYHCLDYPEDKRSPADNTHAWLVTRSLDEVEAWLAPREAEHRKPSPVAMRLLCSAAHVST